MKDVPLEELPDNVDFSRIRTVVKLPSLTDISERLKVGQRFVTPVESLQRALSYSAVYDTTGLVSDV